MLVVNQLYKNISNNVPSIVVDVLRCTPIVGFVLNHLQLNLDKERIAHFELSNKVLYNCHVEYLKFSLVSGALVVICFPLLFSLNAPLAVAIAFIYVVFTIISISTFLQHENKYLKEKIRMNNYLLNRNNETYRLIQEEDAKMENLVRELKLLLNEIDVKKHELKQIKKEIIKQVGQIEFEKLSEFYNEKPDRLIKNAQFDKKDADYRLQEDLLLDELKPLINANDNDQILILLKTVNKIFADHLEFIRAH